MDTTVEENNTFTLTASVDGSGNKTVQWNVNDVPIEGANNLTYTALATMDLNGGVFTVTVANYTRGGDFISQETSTAATLTVTADQVLPTVTGLAGGPPADDKLAVFFSEPVSTATAEVPGNYVLAGGLGTVETAVLQPGNKAVLLTLNPPLQGGLSYTLTVAGIQDLAAVPNNINPDPTVIPFTTELLICTNGIAKREIWLNVDSTKGNNLGILTNDFRYPNNPTTVEYPSVFDINDPGADWDAGRIRAHLTPTVSGFYQFSEISDDAGALWLSPTPHAKDKQVLVDQLGCCSTLLSAPVYLVAGISYYMEAMYENGTGGDYIHIQWKPPGASAYSDIPSTSLSVCVTNDLIAPTLVKASASPVANQVVLTFSKDMADTIFAGPPTSYAFLTNAALQVMLTPTNAFFLPPNYDRVVLQLDGELQANVTYDVIVGGDGMRDRTFNNNLLAPNPSMVQVTGLGIQPGVALRETWTGLITSGPQALSRLTNDTRYPCSPTRSDFITEVASPATSPDASDYGVRIRTFIIPPETANYTFQVRSDDSGRVLIGTDARSSQILVQQDGSCCNESLFSPAIRLIGGTAYYLEALMQEGGGGDYLEVKWKNDASITAYTIIPAANIAYAVDPSTIALAITTDPQPVTVAECRAATFSVGATVSCGGGGISYQWYKNAQVIAGCTGPSCSFVTQLSDDQAMVHVMVSVPGKHVFSQTATVTVTPDDRASSNGEGYGRCEDDKHLHHLLGEH